MDEPKLVRLMPKIKKCAQSLKNLSLENMDKLSPKNA
jgi:hypothetical protein